MQRVPRSPFLRYAMGVFSVWAVLIAALALMIFTAPAPEIGATALFLIFAALLSIPYFAVTFGVYLLASIASDGNERSRS